MIVLENPKPTLDEFKELMRNIDCKLNYDASNNAEYFMSRNGTDLEKDVVEAAVECAKDTKFEGSIQLVSGISFPDIVAAKYYGIEVKSSMSDNWKTIGNSILETTRVSDIERIFLTFGKLRKPVEFMSRPYEQCLSGIAVTHYPRYQIDMSLKEGDTIFDKIGIPYDELRKMDNPITPIANHYRKKLRKGESLWWAGNKIETSVPAIVKLWKSISAKEKDELEATIYAYFPETILSNSHNKYDRATLWLATQKGVINANVRDSFSAGGRNKMKAMDGKEIEMPAVFKKIEDHIELVSNILHDTDPDTLFENWSVDIKENRVRQWIDIVISHAADTRTKANAKEVLTRLFQEHGILDK